MADLTPPQEDPKPADRIRAEAREATRRALLEAGLAETIESGGETPLIDNIVERAGYTRGAFYFYFDDREQFVEEMLDWMNDQLREIVSTTADNDTSIPEVISKFRDFVSTGIWPELQGTVRSAYLAILRGLKPGSNLLESHANVINSGTDRLVGRIQADQAAGRIRDDLDPHHLARMLQLTGVGVVMWSNIGIRLDHAGLTDTLLEFLEARGDQP